MMPQPVQTARSWQVAVPPVCSPYSSLPRFSVTSQLALAHSCQWCVPSWAHSFFQLWPLASILSCFSAPHWVQVKVFYPSFVQAGGFVIFPLSQS